MADPLLDKAERRLLLEEIGRVALAVGRSLFPHQITTDDGSFGAQSSGDTDLLSPRERLAFFTAHIDQIEHAFRHIAHQPKANLRTEERLVMLEHARRPSPGAVTRAVQRAGYLPQRVSDTRTAATFVTPENGWLAAMLSQWCADLNQIAELAVWEEELEVEALAGALALRLQRMLSAPFLADVPVSFARPTEGLLRDARYRRLYQLDSQYRKTLGFAWDLPELRLPAREPWQLYEMWCFFQVASVLGCLGWKVAEGDAVRVTSRGLGIDLAKGQASRLVFSSGNDRLTLFYNRAFPSAAVGSSGVSSRTHTLVPDISLEFNGRFLLLDPKYRAYSLRGDEQDDIVKMHAYRDAILCQGQSVVDQAWCLFPGSRDDGRSVLGYPASTPGEPFGRAGVGAIRLRPGQKTDMLSRLIECWVSSAVTRP